MAAGDKTYTLEARLQLVPVETTVLADGTTVRRDLNSNLDATYAWGVRHFLNDGAQASKGLTYKRGTILNSDTLGGWLKGAGYDVRWAFIRVITAEDNYIRFRRPGTTGGLDICPLEFGFLARWNDEEGDFELGSNGGEIEVLAFCSNNHVLAEVAPEAL